MEERDAILKRKKTVAAKIIPPEELSRLDLIIDRYYGNPGYLIPALKDAQDVFGYLPMEVQRKLAVGLNIPASHIYGVVTFYSFFTIEPRGRNVIRLCLGTACYVKGSKDILEMIRRGLGIDVGETTSDGRFTLEAVRCLGACGLAPVFLVGEDTHGNVTPKDTLTILEGYQ
ncbi:MAG: NAD(P)H-dependent oxidoreductase subunit E [Deltaproteobacteria bacterium]|nr:NAD(P)H-dependent oxidoreductase subunit E [Deltaproteobacteria bacterium]